MPAPIAYFNGEYLDAAQIRLSVTDRGFVQGVAVSEQLRTIGGRLFRLEQHLARLHHSLQVVGLAESVAVDALGEIAQRLAEHNHRLLADGDDLGLSIFVTPGPYPTFLSADTERSAIKPTIGLHTYPLPFVQWVNKYESGQPLVVSQVRQIPPQCWPPELKCRSRMHYYLADQEAARTEPGARALLLDLQDRVIEASTANLIIYRQDTGLISPPTELILPGVSVAFLAELAADLEVPFVHQTLHVPDVLGADEVLLCSTSPCVWPVVSLNGQRIPRGASEWTGPGPVCRQLLATWSECVGIDIRRQAEQFRSRRGPEENQ